MLTKGNFISKFTIILAAIILFTPAVASEEMTKTKEEPIVKSINTVIEATKTETPEFPKPSIEVPKEETKPILASPKPVTYQVAYKPGVEQWRGLCSQYFPEQINNCLAIMNAESGGNPNAISSTQDYGLMQIHAPIWCGFFGVTTAQLQEPETNVRLARVIYNRAGSWRPWSTARKLGL